MTIEKLLLDYWWIFLLLIPALYFYVKWKSKQRIGDLKFKDMAVIFEALGFILIIYLLQVYVFPDVWQFLFSIPIFILIWILAIDKLLEKQNKYVVVTTNIGEKHYSIDDMEIKISPSSESKLLVMDKSVYDEKKHIGEAHYSFWNGSDNIKFADYYDDKTGTFFHPELPQFHNVSIHTARLFLLRAKEDMPELYRKNILLTWLHNYRLGHEQNVLADKFFMHLKTLDRQLEHAPFKLPETIQDLFSEKFKEQQKIALDTEKLEKSDDKQSDKSEGEKSDG